MMIKVQFSKIVFLSVLLLTVSTGCFKSDTAKPYIDPTEYVLPNNMLSPALKNILEITNIPHDGTLESVVQETQKVWLRKPGTERWQMEKKFEELRPQLEVAFKQLGILDEIKPSHNTYDTALILGATLSTIRNRLAYALELWKSGIRFDSLVFLVGERPLDPEKESRQELFDRNNKQLAIKATWQEPVELPKTETEMAKMVFDQTELPQGFLDHVKVYFIDTPMQSTPEGGTRRPNTGDTIKLWLDEMPHPGSILAISNQPYVGYQHAVLKTLVPKELSFQTVGQKVGTIQNVDVMLDNLARWLYQENVLQKQRAS